MEQQQERTETPEAQAPTIDVDAITARVTESVNESLKPVIEGFSKDDKNEPEPDYYNLDPEEQAERTNSRISELEAKLQYEQQARSAYVNANAAEAQVLAQIPDHLRGDAKDTVKQYVSRLVSENPALLAGGLNEVHAKELARMSVGDLALGGKLPMREPAAPLATDDVPFASEIITAYKEAFGRAPTAEELKERSKTWGETRAS